MLLTNSSASTSDSVSKEFSQLSVYVGTDEGIDELTDAESSSDSRMLKSNPRVLVSLIVVSSSISEKECPLCVDVAHRMQALVWQLSQSKTKLFWCLGHI